MIGGVPTFIDTVAGLAPGFWGSDAFGFDFALTGC